ncbi:MAG: shikimate kinase [Arenimonas sp. SCN 70-307]|uniref:shikimate kinase n=1 Tax=Arenimonas sp. SCN 70-307 TaxID=1660089 RepID=UPI00086BA0B2|nr:shikimate kinase [Arenimonas sp. SCN 70-307]ODS62951.1 MAG: shikimate kinase [Arenimonas sp. SCN 70-307]
MNPAPNLVLVGPMGAGKTSIGRQLARRLDLAFVDCDHLLEERTGVAVPVIFECEGEAGFRQREAALVAELMQGRGQLVATGGGAVLDEANRRALSARGFVVWLQASVPQQLERLARDRSRPLLAGSDKQARLEALAAQRGPIYAALADLAFDADGLSVAAATDRLHAQVQAHWQRVEAA